MPPSQQLSFAAAVLPAGVLPSCSPSEQQPFAVAVLRSSHPTELLFLLRPSFPAAVIPPCHPPLLNHFWQLDQLGPNASTEDLHSNLSEGFRKRKHQVTAKQEVEQEPGATQELEVNQETVVN